MLLARRAIEPAHGLWTFPGGYVDWGESVAEAARREMREEVGLDLDPAGLVGIYSYPGAPAVIVVYHVTVPDGLDAAADAARGERDRLLLSRGDPVEQPRLSQHSRGARGLVPPPGCIVGLARCLAAPVEGSREATSDPGRDDHGAGDPAAARPGGGRAGTAAGRERLARRRQPRDRGPSVAQPGGPGARRGWEPRRPGHRGGHGHRGAMGTTGAMGMVTGTGPGGAAQASAGGSGRASSRRRRGGHIRRSMRSRRTPIRRIPSTRPILLPIPRTDILPRTDIRRHRRRPLRPVLLPRPTCLARRRRRRSPCPRSRHLRRLPR